MKHSLAPLCLLVVQAEIRVVPDGDEFRQDRVISQTECLAAFPYRVEALGGRIVPALDATVGIYVNDLRV